MQIQGIYAALATKDMAKAEEFYTMLFGRAPDDRPMAKLIQWRDIAGANIQIFDDEKNAGAGRLTIVVPEMERTRAYLARYGVAITHESQEDYGRVGQIADPDGNRITLAEPPTRPSIGAPLDELTEAVVSRPRPGRRERASHRPTSRPRGIASPRSASLERAAGSVRRLSRARPRPDSS